MRDQDADCVAKPRRTSRCCNSMGSRAFCDTRTGGMLIGYARVSTQETREESPEKRRRTPLTTFWAAETQLGTHSLCQEPSETGALSPSTLVRNAPLSVQNRTNLPDTLTPILASPPGHAPGSHASMIRVVAPVDGGASLDHGSTPADPVSPGRGRIQPPILRSAFSKKR